MSSFVLHAAWYLLGFIILVSCLFLPTAAECTGYCCNQSKTARRLLTGSRQHETLPYQVRVREESLARVARTAGTPANSQQPPATLQIKETFFTGVTTLAVPHQPLYHLPRLAAEAQPVAGTKDYRYLRKNLFSLITMSGKTGTADEIFYSVYLSQALAKPNATVIVNGMNMDSPAFEAWSRLVFEDIVQWDGEVEEHGEERWARGQFKDIQPAKAPTEYVVDVMKDVLELTTSDTEYYSMSREREDEFRRHHADDRRVVVPNLSGLIHASVMQVLFPDIKCDYQDLHQDHDDYELFERGKEFVQTYFSPVSSSST